MSGLFRRSLQGVQNFHRPTSPWGGVSDRASTSSLCRRDKPPLRRYCSVTILCAEHLSSTTRTKGDSGGITVCFLDPLHPVWVWRLAIVESGSRPVVVLPSHHGMRVARNEKRAKRARSRYDDRVSEVMLGPKILCTLAIDEVAELTGELDQNDGVLARGDLRCAFASRLIGDFPEKAGHLLFFVCHTPRDVCQTSRKWQTPTSKRSARLASKSCSSKAAVVEVASKMDSNKKSKSEYAIETSASKAAASDHRTETANKKPVSPSSRKFSSPRQQIALVAYGWSRPRVPKMSRIG